jgi:hypothetical protein
VWEMLICNADHWEGVMGNYSNVFVLVARLQGETRGVGCTIVDDRNIPEAIGTMFASRTITQMDDWLTETPCRSGCNAGSGEQTHERRHSAWIPPPFANGLEAFTAIMVPSCAIQRRIDEQVMQSN